MKEDKMKSIKDFTKIKDQITYLTRLNILNYPILMRLGLMSQLKN